MAAEKNGWNVQIAKCLNPLLHLLESRKLIMPKQFTAETHIISWLMAVLRCDILAWLGATFKIHRSNLVDIVSKRCNKWPNGFEGVVRINNRRAEFKFIKLIKNKWMLILLNNRSIIDVMPNPISIIIPMISQTDTVFYVNLHFTRRLHYDKLCHHKSMDYLPMLWSLAYQEFQRHPLNQS